MIGGDLLKVDRGVEKDIRGIINETIYSVNTVSTYLVTLLYSSCSPSHPPCLIQGSVVGQKSRKVGKVEESIAGKEKSEEQIWREEEREISREKQHKKAFELFKTQTTSFSLFQ